MHVRCYYCGRASASAAAGEKKQTCIRGWLAEQADEWLWAGTRVRFEVILCALTGRLNLGPGVVGANQTLGEQGCQVLCKSVPQSNQRPGTDLSEDTSRASRVG